MLGDQAQKQKNTFKSSMRRRRKTVTFAEPTIVNYSDFDYSTEEEDIEELFGPQSAASQQNDKQKSDEQKDDRRVMAGDESAEESARVEPLRTRTNKEDTTTDSPKDEPAAQDDSRGSDESSDGKTDAPSRSRNGTVRNTDSFFKDESVETKKITLTPNLLRDDNTPRGSSESLNRDLRSRSSLDKLDKELVSDKDRKKAKEKDKKDKDKRPSAIRSFFSRKDKKKSSEDDDESFGKRSMDIIPDSRENDDRAAEDSADKQAQRSAGKLQKAAPAGKAPDSGPGPKSVELSSYLAEGRTNDVSNVPPVSMRIVSPETRETQEALSNQQQPKLATRERSSSNAAQQVISKIIPSRSASMGADAKPQKTVKAKTRMELDASDSSGVEDGPKEPSEQASSRELSNAEEKEQEKPSRPQLPGSFPDSYQSTSTVSSNVTVTPQQPQQNPPPGAHTSSARASPVSASNPPALVVDTSSPEANSPEASPSPDKSRTSASNERTESSASREPTWDDAKLRAFFDETGHIRDLLAVVYDKSDVEPAGSDHPVVGGLFREQNAKLAEITTVSNAPDSVSRAWADMRSMQQLDNMLGDWLARKQRLRGAI